MNPTLFLVFIFTAVTIFAVYQIIAPFLVDRRDQLRFELLDDEIAELERLVSRKSVLLQSLRDIESDHETGKISDEDYERLKTKYERRAVGVMRKLDELRGGVDKDDEIDQALAARLEARSDAADEEPAEPAETTDTIQCPECDKQLEAEARFCSRCGVPIGEDDSSTETDESVSEQADAETPHGEEPTEAPAEAGEPNVGELRSEVTG